MGRPNGGANLFGIHPRHFASDQRTNRNAQEGDDTYNQGPEESPREEIPFAYWCSKEDLVGFLIKIAGGGTIEKCCDHQEAQKRKTGIIVLHDIRRILEHITYPTANGNVVAAGCPKYEQGVNQKENIGDGLAQPVSQFESEDGKKHTSTFRP